MRMMSITAARGSSVSLSRNVVTSPAAAEAIDPEELALNVELARSWSMLKPSNRKGMATSI